MPSLIFSQRTCTAFLIPCVAGKDLPDQDCQLHAKDLARKDSHSEMVLQTHILLGINSLTVIKQYIAAVLTA